LFSNDWLTSDFHFAVTQLVKRLYSSAWLAKTILIVAPSDAQPSMVETVENFLDAFLGSTTNASISMLPPQITSTLLRNVLVVQHFIESGGPLRADLKILPQGRRGVLPNMDLVFHVMSIYARATFMDPRRNPSTMFVHPCIEKSVQWREYVGKHLPRQYHEWAVEVGDMGLFAYTMTMGPYAPHAPALERGLDSLTLELNLGGKHPRSQGPTVVEFVQQLEHVIHGLSNLHERLHHSLTLYVLPSPYKFVSYSEYVIPNILLLVPLLVKVLVLLLVEVDVFDFSAIGKAMMAVIVGVTCLVVSSANMNLYHYNGFLFVSYMAVGLFSRQVHYTHKFASKSLLIMACLVAIYSHVPLLIGHASLAYPSAMLWSPFLLMFNYEARSIWQRFIWAVILLVTWPPFFLIPNIFETPTPYVCLVFTPMHLLLAMLWDSGKVISE
jgi:Gaa1-like, GPI transamidase component